LILGHIAVEFVEGALDSVQLPIAPQVLLANP
jgi:hypothetical protein